MTVKSNYKMPIHSLLLRCRVLDNMPLVNSFSNTAHPSRGILNRKLNDRGRGLAWKKSMRAGQRCKVTFFSPLILIRDSCKTISVIGYSEYALRTGFPDPYQSIHEDKEQDYSLENQSHSGRSFAALIEVKSHMRPPPYPSTSHCYTCGWKGYMRSIAKYIDFF